MARLPKNVHEAVEGFDIRPGQRVLAFAPDAGYLEALGEAVGDDGMVLVEDPPADAEAPANVKLEVADDATGDVVLAWISSPHEARERTHRVSDGGALWAVLPRVTAKGLSAVKEADVKRSLLAAGWRDDRTVALSTETYAVRFRRRR